MPDSARISRNFSASSIMLNWVDMNVTWLSSCAETPITPVNMLISVSKINARSFLFILNLLICTRQYLRQRQQRRVSEYHSIALPPFSAGARPAARRADDQLRFQ